MMKEINKGVLVDENGKIFMKPGKDNREDRLNFVRYWVEFMKKTKSDKEWSQQQNVLIDSQIRE